MACIFVTGGGRGIGRAVALAFAEPGATVAIASRTRDQLDRTARDIRDRGADAMALEMDVTDSTSVQSALSRLQSRGSRIDVLVNNASSRRADESSTCRQFSGALASLAIRHTARPSTPSSGSHAHWRSS
ncbi:MAG: SDR family NAD(P)-dependent oxidoreductase [Acidobacteria bacterium]|nr:SDR family NAD(P)-dependent oxidoreductase [Acidobacteriota bacterium]